MFANKSEPMRKRGALCNLAATFLLAAARTICANDISSTATGGSWNSGSTWVGGVVPTSSDNVTIVSGAIVTGIGSNNSLLLAGTLQYGAGGGGGTIAQDLTINSGATLSCTTAAASSLTVNGNIINDGTFNMTGSATTVIVSGSITNNSSFRVRQLTFSGSSNATFGGNGGTTDLFRMTVNKGTDATSILELNPANFTVSNGNADNFLTLTNGTLKIGGTFTRSGTVFLTSVNIPATAEFWLDNPNFTVVGTQTTGNNAGTLRISQGSFHVGIDGSGTLATLNGATGANFIFDGGTLQFNHGFAPTGAVNVTISGGNVNCNVLNNGTNSAALNLNASSNFTMSGGTIFAGYANPGGGGFDYRVLGPATITGGTLQMGFNNGTFRIRGPTPALSLTSGMTQLVGATDVRGNITINAGRTLDTNGFALLLYGTTIANDGAITGTLAGSAFNFVGSSAQTYSGSGSFGTVAIPFGGSGIIIDNPNGVTANADVVTSTLTLNNGVANTSSGSALVIPSGGTVVRTNGHVAGNLRRTFAAAGSQIFDVGTPSTYSPATVNVTSATFPADVKLKSNSGRQPNYSGITTLKRYWTIAALTDVIADLTFQYPAADIVGDESAYGAARYAAGFTAFGALVNTSAHTATIAGATALSGDWLLLEPDNDFDGMPNAWEIAHGLNPNDPSDAGIDSDNDGLTNFEEFLSGTDPQSGSSAFRITSIVQSGNDICVAFPSVAGRTYRLENKTALSDPNWIQVGTDQMGTNGSLQICDPNAAALALRFYRVELILP